MVTGQAPVILELRNTPGKNTNNPRWYTHISQLTHFMPPPETYKREIGSQSTVCQVHTGAYFSLLVPGKTDYTACHPRKTTTYTSHVVSITTHTHDRRKSLGEQKQTVRYIPLARCINDERWSPGCLFRRKQKLFTPLRGVHSSP